MYVDRIGLLEDLREALLLLNEAYRVRSMLRV